MKSPIILLSRIYIYNFFARRIFRKILAEILAKFRCNLLCNTIFLFKIHVYILIIKFSLDVILKLYNPLEFILTFTFCYFLFCILSSCYREFDGRRAFYFQLLAIAKTSGISAFWLRKKIFRIQETFSIQACIIYVHVESYFKACRQHVRALFCAYT